MTATDRARQVTVTAAEIFCVVGTLYSVGLLGTRVAESSGGALVAELRSVATAVAAAIAALVFLAATAGLRRRAPEPV